MEKTGGVAQIIECIKLSTTNIKRSSGMLDYKCDCDRTLNS
jgi:hypothetical protein